MAENPPKSNLNPNPEPINSEKNVVRVAELLEAFGAEPDRAGVMAAQLIKRAGQKAAETGQTEIEALSELIAEIARIRG